LWSGKWRNKTTDGVNLSRPLLNPDSHPLSQLIFLEGTLYVATIKPSDTKWLISPGGYVSHIAWCHCQFGGLLLRAEHDLQRQSIYPFQSRRSYSMIWSALLKLRRCFAVACLGFHLTALRQAQHLMHHLLSERKITGSNALWFLQV
jgi:hypothetical protein